MAMPPGERNFAYAQADNAVRKIGGQLEASATAYGRGANRIAGHVGNPRGCETGPAGYPRTVRCRLTFLVPNIAG